ncbi:MAG: hydrogenase formation protein HypD, partial [Armatimonadetes bacterium]|nr:hydrogenase formation protein HypD [Armatimonadota bacterium]
MPLSEAGAVRVNELARRLAEAGGRLERPVRLMEVCGTHAHVVGRYGLRQLLPPNVDLISGPGCPVCVTTGGQVEMALQLARCGLTVATFGDLVRVPGPSGSLADVRASGADVRVVYSPQQALDIALEESGREVVFVAVGFETTAPAVAAVARQALQARVKNLSFLCLHKTIPPALEALVKDKEVGVDGFLCPGHVSVIIGSEAYRPLASDYGVPCVVAGFEPTDIMLGLAMLAEQLADGRCQVENAYTRAVRPQGNPVARAVMDEVLEPVDAAWRGLGVVAAGGLALKEKYRGLCAAERYRISEREADEPAGCRCGD